MKIWLAVVLLTAVVLSTAAPAKNEAKISTEVIKADVEDSTLASTDITETDEDSEATDTPLKATTGEKNEPEKEKSEKMKQKDEGDYGKEENEENENEENENEENENEEEDSDEGDSEEEDSEESEGKKSFKNKIKKVESEEENHEGKAGAVEIPTRARPVDSPVAIQPHRAFDVPRSGSRMSKSESFFSPAKSTYGTAGTHNPRPDSPKSSAVEFPFWHTPVVPAKPLNEERPVSPSIKFHQAEEHKTKHPKWFFSTPKSKPSDDSSSKNENSKPFVAESTINKPADVQVPAWQVTNTRPAVRGSYNPTVSQSDHSNSQSKWFFNTATKSSDEFGRKESRQSADIERVTHKSTTVQSDPWSKPVIASPSTVQVPAYKAADVSQPSTRKVYPRWFFNIKD
ncbi:SPARC-like protein 1 [Daphnia carinata]|uniref:SPARC-like protein 1 n=1 Tax=Daphnia carinata TaxID=120202 RepID=UPI00257FC4EF|nr:SPARC-like protein 1 [Daphnia carinata]